jgi:deoxyribodipyrimidine photo-lyase
MTDVPTSALDPRRLRVACDRPPQAGDWVLYWMIATRRTESNAALDRAIEWARARRCPLVVLEPLRCDYPYASDRLHRFVLDGMADNRRAFEGTPVTYHPYVEPEVGAGRGLLAALARRATVVVTDEYPTFFLPRMVAAAAEASPVRMEVVDSCGLVPLRATEGPFKTAFAFRRWLQHHLIDGLDAVPRRTPLRRLDLPRLETLPVDLLRRWPAAPVALLEGQAGALEALPIDHGVAPTGQRGGPRAGEQVLERFVSTRLESYAEERDHPDAEATSELSPYLHFGHVSAWAAFRAVTAAEDWDPSRVADRKDGRRGWYGASPSGEAFLEQLVTWRELGHGFAWHVPEHASYDALPDWARATLEEHRDRSAPTVSLERLRAAESDDELWNAAQRELLRDGRIHNALRMLWGKKILEWAPDPRQAAEWMVELNDRYALDGRDPNSYSGIFWCLGRFDRPWGPKRRRFGSVRYMSSPQAARKRRVKAYLERYGRPASGSLFAD